MRKRSKTMEFARRELIEGERRMTPEQRLQACVNLSALVVELHRQGELHRASLGRPHGRFTAP